MLVCSEETYCPAEDIFRKRQDYSIDFSFFTYSRYFYQRNLADGILISLSLSISENKKINLGVSVLLDERAEFKLVDNDVIIFSSGADSGGRFSLGDFELAVYGRERPGYSIYKRPTEILIGANVNGSSSSYKDLYTSGMELDLKPVSEIDIKFPEIVANGDLVDVGVVKFKKCLVEKKLFKKS